MKIICYRLGNTTSMEPPEQPVMVKGVEVSTDEDGDITIQVVCEDLGPEWVQRAPREVTY